MKVLSLIFFIIVGLAPKISLAEFDHSHKEFNKILRQNVVSDQKQTLVKYQELKKDPSLLDKYLETLSIVSQKEFDSFLKKEQLAFLINAYNAFTLKLIVKNYPVDSIKDIGSLFKSAWKKNFFKLLGETRNLDYIEHDKIRKDFDEPRIHFAVNCASISCPNLQNFAFTAQKMDQQLNISARLFILDETKNRYDSKKNKIVLSKIFKWYGGDFKKKYGHYLNYIAPIISKDPLVQKKIKGEDISTSFFNYDWNLNDRK